MISILVVNLEYIELPDQYDNSYLYIGYGGGIFIALAGINTDDTHPVISYDNCRTWSILTDVPIDKWYTTTYVDGKLYIISGQRLAILDVVETQSYLQYRGKRLLDEDDLASIVARLEALGG